MRLKTLMVFIIVGVCFSAVLAEKPRKFKKAKVEEKKTFLSLQEKLQQLQEEEAELEEELEDELDLEAGDVDRIIDFPSLTKSFETEEEEPQHDPCQEMFCGAGRECIITEEGKGLCQCLEKCNDIEDDRRKACSNHNETWPSDCELYRMRCLCSEGSEECRNEEYEHMHIDYYGNCQQVSECKENEMSDFPRRMREWLFNIMRDMADRDQLSEHYMKMEKLAEKEDDDRKKWSKAAIWKWCELDGHPRDRSVSRHELFPLRAPLFALEHCIAPFLDSCDPDDDHNITLKEWANCLELSKEHTDNLEDLCDDIRDE